MPDTRSRTSCGTQMPVRVPQDFFLARCAQPSAQPGPRPWSGPSGVKCFRPFLIRSLRYLNGGTLSPVPTEAGQNFETLLSKQALECRLWEWYGGTESYGGRLPGSFPNSAHL